MSLIKIIPVAEESFGVRSMCFYIETPDIKLLVDAGLSLAPRRFGYPPHPLEFKAVKLLREKVIQYAKSSSVIFVSHYHYDHITPNFSSWYEWIREDTYKEIYREKVLLIKDPKNKINPSQLRRAHAFLRSVKDLAKEIKIADSSKFVFGNTIIEVSEPVPHGSEGTRLGYVLMLKVQYEDESVVYTSDVEGPMAEKTLSLILDYSPTTLIVGGPPLYLARVKVPEGDVNKGIASLKLLALSVPEIILCHHTLRASDWRERMRPVIETAEAMGHNVLTAAEYLGLRENLLEANRKILYEEKPPSEEFLRWIKLPKEKRVNLEPPLI